jgi:hypothetical protein
MRWVWRFLLGLGALCHASDWRAELLAEAGFEADREGLRRALTEFEAPVEQLAGAYAQLGAARYPDRQRAQERILAAGPAALDWLDRQPPSKQPEIRLRLEQIRRTLALEPVGQRRRLQLHAARTLLAEIDGPPDPACGGLFYEAFSRPAESLREGYRHFELDAAVDMPSRVSKQKLVHEGQRPGDGDQRLVLRSQAWPGSDTFPESFEIRAVVQGREGAAGRWHLGISVGNIRALYHPGYANGAFRFQNIRTGEQLVRNQDMGFTPSTEHPQQMHVRVARQGPESIELSVTIRQDDQPPFRQSLVVGAASLGPLDQISLDRSGRGGGDAVFHQLVVNISEN